MKYAVDFNFSHLYFTIFNQYFCVLEVQVDRLLSLRYSYLKYTVLQIFVGIRCMDVLQGRILNSKRSDHKIISELYPTKLHMRNVKYVGTKIKVSLSCCKYYYFLFLMTLFFAHIINIRNAIYAYIIWGKSDPLFTLLINRVEISKGWKPPIDLLSDLSLNDMKLFWNVKSIKICYYIIILILLCIPSINCFNYFIILFRIFWAILITWHQTNVRTSQ